MPGSIHRLVMSLLLLSTAGQWLLILALPAEARSSLAGVASAIVLVSVMVAGIALSRVRSQRFKPVPAPPPAPPSPLDTETWLALFARADVGIALIDAKSQQLTAVNDTFARFHGYSVDEMSGMPVEQLQKLVPEERITGAEDQMVKRVHVRKDGSEFPVRADVTTFSDTLDRPMLHVMQLQDLTLTQRTEQALQSAFIDLERRVDERTMELNTVIRQLRQEIQERRRAEEQLYALTTKAHCLLWQAEVTVSGENELTWIPHLLDTEAALRFLPLDLQPNQTYLEAWRNSCLDEDRKPRDERAEAAIRAGRNYRQEFRCRRRDGEIRWLSQDVQLEALGPNRWLATGVCTDITDYKRVAEEVRASAARYRRILETTSDGVVTLDAQQRITYANRRFCEMVGHSLPELLSRPLLELARPSAQASFARCLAGETPEGNERQDVRLLCSNQTSLWCECAVRPIQDEESEPGTLVVITDVTERRKLEAVLQQRVAALAQADRRKDEFLAILAHELRNPLAAISNAAFVMEHVDAEDPLIDRMRSIITHQSQHLSRLVDDLLDVSRIAEGKIELRRAPIDLNTVVQQAIAVLQPVADLRAQRIRVTLSPTPLWVEGDANRLEQVALNLLHNAIKYTPAGGQIWISTLQQDATLTLRIRDTGQGISPELLPRIFHLFVQAELSSDRHQGGLGVGLALVQTLVELHGGSISAHSDGLGQGAEFTVELPAGPPAEIANERPPLLTTRSTPIRVLLVDDNKDAVETLQEMLTMWGYETEVVYSGPAALEILERGLPDAVILDIGMPEMSGYEVVQHIRTRWPREPLRLIALTGYIQERDRQRALETGFDAHLGKPVSPDDLKSLLSELLPTPRA